MVKKNKKFNGKNGNGGKKFNLRGKVDELGNNVFTYGAKGSAERYTKTVDVIGAYLGRLHGKKAQLLIERVESPPVEPKEPPKPADKDEFSFAVKKCEKELERFWKKKDEWEDIKAISFVTVHGQCTLAMRNKVEAEQGFKTWKSDDNVIALLDAIKDLAFAKTSIQYEYWSLVVQTKKLSQINQGPDESLPTFYKRFIANRDVLEEMWGTFAPTKIMLDSKQPAEVVAKKFAACLFLAGVDKKRFGRVAEELNNQFLSGSNNYPSSVEAAMNVLSHRMDSSEGPAKAKAEHADDDDSVSVETSFSQASSSPKRNKKKVVCHVCGGKGHYANQCPSKDSDNDSCVGWNGFQARARSAFVLDD